MNVDGREVASVDMPKTWPTHGTTAGLYCGRDSGSPVSDSYVRPFRFTGKIHRVLIELGSDGGPASSELFETVLSEQ